MEKKLLKSEKNAVENKKELIVEQGHVIYDDKLKQMNGIYSSGKKTMDEKKDEMNVVYKKRMDDYKKAAEEIKKFGGGMVENGKEKVMTVYTHTREEFIDRPQKFITDLLQSKYENLKVQYPTVKRVDDFCMSGKKAAEAQKEKVDELYARTCKYYSDQKEAAKELGMELFRNAQDYLKDTLTKIEEENGGNDVNGNKGEDAPPPSFKEIGYEVFDFTKQELENVAKKYVFFALRLMKLYKSRINHDTTGSNEEKVETHEEKKGGEDLPPHGEDEKLIVQQ